MSEYIVNVKAGKRLTSPGSTTTVVIDADDVPEGMHAVVTGVVGMSGYQIGLNWLEDDETSLVPGTWWAEDVSGLDLYRSSGLFAGLTGEGIKVGNPTQGDIALSITYRLVRS